MSRQDRMIFRMELRQFFSMRRIPLFVFFAIIGVLLVVQESEIPFWAILFVITFAILEGQFNNILFRTPHEFEILNMFPVPWRSVVLVKNIATIVLTMTVVIIMLPVFLYFSPRATRADVVVDALLYATTIMFPMLDFGNEQSIRTPRRHSAWRMDDAVQAMGMLVFVLILSLPYVVITELIHAPALNVLYGIAAASYWYARSIPNTVLRIELKRGQLCATP